MTPLMLTKYKFGPYVFRGHCPFFIRKSSQIRRVGNGVPKSEQTQTERCCFGQDAAWEKGPLTPSTKQGASVCP
jgi:hypothetical protein